MHTTTFAGDFRTRTLGGEFGSNANPELMNRYQILLDDRKLQWMTYHKLDRILGSGGQGIVFFSTRLGADGFALPVAMKVFSPERFGTQAGYDEAMARIGLVAATVARIQHESVLSIHDFIDRNRIRILIMEWIDGYDLRDLLRLERMAKIRNRLSQRRWDYINNVVVTAGPAHARFKAGVAVAIVRDCLAGLAVSVIMPLSMPVLMRMKQTNHQKHDDQACKCAQPSARA